MDKKTEKLIEEINAKFEAMELREIEKNKRQVRWAEAILFTLLFAVLTACLCGAIISTVLGYVPFIIGVVTSAVISILILVEMMTAFYVISRVGD